MDRVAFRERVRDGWWRRLSDLPRMAVVCGSRRPRSWGDGIFELRVGVGRVAGRVTFCFAEDWRVVLLTTFSQAGAERAGRSPGVLGGDAAVRRWGTFTWGGMMARPTFGELRQRRLNTMSVAERGEFDAAVAVARLALGVGEKVRDAREAAGVDTARSCGSYVDEPRRRLLI